MAGFRSFAGELVAPTRTLGGPEKAWGGLFKGSFVTFSPVEEKKAAAEPLKGVQPQAVSAPQLPEEPKREDLSLWERFVNGSLKHF